MKVSITECVLLCDCLCVCVCVHARTCGLLWYPFVSFNGSEEAKLFLIILNSLIPGLKALCPLLLSVGIIACKDVNVMSSGFPCCAAAEHV